MATGGLAVVLVLILMVVWFGIRHALLNPLARVITHIREIASGDLTKTLTVSGRNEIGELAGTVEHMQRSLIDTVTQVREGSMRFIPAPVKLPPVIPTSLPVPNNKPPLWKRRRPAWNN